MVVAASMVGTLAAPAGAAQPVAVTVEQTAAQSASPADLAPLVSAPPAAVTGDIPAGTFTAPQMADQSTPAPDPALDPDAVEGFDPSTSTVVRREEFQQVYRNTDGTFTTKLSQDPVNVLSTSGEWEPVSTVVTGTTDGGGRVAAHPLKPRFAGKADAPGLLKVSRGGADVQVALVGASGKPMQRAGSGVKYIDVLPDADLSYEVTNGAVKEAVVLKRAPKRPQSYSWLITGSNFTIEEGRDGSFDIVSGGKVAMSIPPAVVVDSSGRAGQSGPAEVNAPMTVTPSGDGWLLTVTPDHAWLTDPARVYPVSVDPTIDVATNDNTWAYRSDGDSPRVRWRLGYLVPALMSAGAVGA